MKKFYTLLTVLFFASQSIFAGAGCVIDTTNTQFFSPGADSLPCVERGVSYSQVIQIHVPETIDIGPFVGFPAGIIILTVDSMQIDSITGFPTGLGYNLIPADGHFLGGDNGCAYAYGTTNDPAGNYPLSVHGTISVSGIPSGFGFPSDTTFDLANAQNQSGMFSLGVDVIEQGAECRPNTSVNDFSAELNSLVQVYPNPSNGVFSVRIDAGRRVKGELVIVDVTGRKVFTEQIDAVGLYNNTVNLSQFGKGLYTVQVRTADGFASKNISVE